MGWSCKPIRYTVIVRDAKNNNLVILDPELGCTAFLHSFPVVTSELQKKAKEHDKINRSIWLKVLRSTDPANVDSDDYNQLNFGLNRACGRTCNVESYGPLHRASVSTRHQKFLWTPGSRELAKAKQIWQNKWSQLWIRGEAFQTSFESALSS